MIAIVSEILWIMWLVSHVEASQSGRTSLHHDNEAARHIANNHVFHERTKHGRWTTILHVNE